MCLSESQSSERNLSVHNAFVLMLSFSCPAGGIAAAALEIDGSDLSPIAGWDELHTTNILL